MKVLLVDDHSLFREGIAMLLNAVEPDVETFEAGSFDAACDLLRAHANFAIVLMDLQLPGTSGLNAIREIRNDYPHIPIVAVSSTEDKDSVLRALDAGAMGYIPKSSTSSVLRAALQLVLSGGIYLPPSVFLAEHVGSSLSPRIAQQEPRRDISPMSLGLTVRQTEVLSRILEGKSAKVISRELGLSGSTVKVHTSAVLRALNVTTRTQAVLAASRLGLKLRRASSPGVTPPQDGKREH